MFINIGEVIHPGGSRFRVGNWVSFHQYPIVSEFEVIGGLTSLMFLLESVPVGWIFSEFESLSYVDGPFLMGGPPGTEPGNALFLLQGTGGSELPFLVMEPQK